MPHEGSGASEMPAPGPVRPLEGSATPDDPGARVRQCAESSGYAPEELLEPIDTIVVLMMENRSFDHYFGSATFTEGWDVDGLIGTESNPGINGEPVQVYHSRNLDALDPPHYWSDCHAQWNGGSMDGFARTHAEQVPLEPHGAMSYYTRREIPMLYALAQNYALCEQWYSSVLGPTWPNRFYLHGATSGGAKSNVPKPRLHTIWETLREAGLSGKNYYHDVAWALGSQLSLGSYLHSVESFFSDAAAGTLPSFSIIDPNFGIFGGGGNDDHPPHSIALGQMLIASIYQAMAQSPQWNRCMFIITYDEHGGFYDHAPPPSVTDERLDFTQLGVRVPSIVIGPYVRQGCAVSAHLDHVSILSTLAKKWNLPFFNARMEEAQDLSVCIDPSTLRAPRAPVVLPQMLVSMDDVMRRREGANQPELRELVQKGEIPLPREHRRVDPGYQLKLRTLERAQKFGLVNVRV